ncbi:MAG: hypothetical protein C5B54_10875, partial [Acidobacteria bacterium]
MAIDKAKVLKSAEKFIASGKIAQAIEEYLKILKENPKDWNLMIQIGDLCLKINKTPDAIQQFQRVADHYYADGFFLKAIAIYKRINKLDPSLTDICIKLADLYLKQGLTMDAKTQLQVVAQHYVSKNQTKDAIQTFQKLVEIEPDNLKIRNELARAYKAEGMLSEAIKEYLEICDELSRKNLWKESLAVLDTAHKLDQKNSLILRKLLSTYHELGDSAKGTALLEETLKQDPSSPEVLSLLAETYADRNQFQRAQETIDKAILGTPNKEPLWTLKGDLFLRGGDLDRAYAQYSLVVERLIQKKETEKAVALLQKVTAHDPTYHPALQRLVEVHTVSRNEGQIIAACNALVDAYISKAMYLDASKYLDKLIHYEPENVQHQEKLEFVRSFLDKPKAGAPQKAEAPPPSPPQPKTLEVAMIPEEIATEDFEISIDLQPEESVELDEPPAPSFEPPPPIAAEPVPVVTVDQNAMETPIPARNFRVPPQQQQPKAVSPSVAVATLQVSDEEKEFVSEHLIEAEVFTKYGLIDKALEQLQIIVAKFPNSLMARQKLKEIYLEKGDRDKAVEE